MRPCAPQGTLLFRDKTLRRRRVGDKLRGADALAANTKKTFEKARARFALQTPAVAPHIDLGRRGERVAADYLRARGYELVASNFKTSVGRNRRGAVVQNEIDLVAYDGPVLCFVEVKTRRSDRFAAPEANVDLRKQRQVTRAARAYRRLLGSTERAPPLRRGRRHPPPARRRRPRARPPRRTASQLLDGGEIP